MIWTVCSWISIAPDASVELIDRQIRNMDGSYRQSRYIIAKIDILRDMGKMEEAQKTADEFMHIDEVCRHEVEWLQSLNRLDDALSCILMRYADMKWNGFNP